MPNLEILDLTGSLLIECSPNLSGTPNLKELYLSFCERLRLVDPSIFSLQKLERLRMNGCISLKSLSSNTCPPASTNHLNLRDLSIGPWCLSELPSSILDLKDLSNFYCPITDDLVDLPAYFSRTIVLYDPWDPENVDTLLTLCKLLPNPAFLSVEHLVFRWCFTLSEIPNNISVLSSLRSLTLIDCAIICLPQTIKCLPQLHVLTVGRCKMLQSIPMLPQSIKSFCVWNCESLQTVSSLTSEPHERSYYCGYGFLYLNCIKLDPHSYDTILKDAIVRIEHRARLHSAISENVEDASWDHDLYLLPAISGKVRDWFHYHSTQASFSVELPPNLLGFVYYMVLSQGRMGSGGGFGCECNLETSSGERINITSFARIKDELTFFFICDGYNYSYTTMSDSDHVVLWYDARCCKEIIMEAVEERKAINDASTRYTPELTFRFFVETPGDEEVTIKECGFHWIYHSEVQIGVEEGGRSHVLEAREVCQFDEQEITVAPTKKIKASLILILILILFFIFLFYKIILQNYF